MAIKVALNWSRLYPYNEPYLSLYAPKKPGVYRISAVLDDKLRVVYVGKTENLSERLLNHRRFFEPNTFLKSVLEEKECFFAVCELLQSLDRQNVEFSLFRYYHPFCNIVEPKGEAIEINYE